MLSLNSLEARVQAARARAEEICAALEREAHKLGFAQGQVQVPTFEAAHFSLQRDAASGRDSLLCDWHDDKGRRNGHLLFHADGSFWAEYDVVRPHPRDARWFVESVTAWGRNDSIKSEARLLPIVG
ncbi:MAG: hypothetical protein P8Y64_02470 [Gammaproteobacteria bacterium]|jgi:hypothetical protein